MKTLGYPAFSHEALGDWKDVSVRGTERSEGSYGNILVAASVAALGLHPWDIKVKINQVLVELGQAASIMKHEILLQTLRTTMKILTRNR